MDGKWMENDGKWMENDGKWMENDGFHGMVFPQPASSGSPSR